MKDLVAKTGEYEKDGETKARWTKVGVILENENGEYALLDPTVDLSGVLIKQRLLNPEKASGSIICSIFNKESSGSSAPSGPQPGGGDFDGDIPFAPLDWRI